MSRAGLALVLAAAAVLLLTATPAAPQAVGDGRVLAVEFASAVNPVTRDYVVGQIDRAERQGYEAVVILVDTPGGLDASMRDIVQAQLDAQVPVVHFVFPPGARSASAGLFLAMGSDVVAMAPNTAIGAATPVAVGGDEIPDDVRGKIINDAVAYIRALAEEHDRNADWAERAVREGVSLPARAALEQNVIEHVAPDLPTLLAELDGTEIPVKDRVLDTDGAPVDRVEMSLWQRILDRLIDPNIVLLLMSLGVLGITIEILNPGLIFPGTLGTISVVIALFGLQVLPVSWAGVVLLILAATFFVAELFVGSGGVLAAAGTASFVFGALLLFDPAGPAYEISIVLVLAIAGTLGVFFGVAMAKVVQARRRKPATGHEEMLGLVGRAREPLDPEGLVFLHGELWRARAADGPIEPGEGVRVESIGDDLVLEVRPEHESRAA